MKKLNLREIAETNGLTYIETTSERNGYPANIKGAIIGFDTFEQAKELADKHNLSIEMFNKKDGWQLWYRTGNRMGEAMRNSSEDYGDNYSELGKMGDKEFYEREVKDMLENFDNLADLQNCLSEMEEIASEIEMMDDDEIVITLNGRYYETIKRESMSWYHDTKHIAIGLIDNNDYTEQETDED